MASSTLALWISFDRKKKVGDVNHKPKMIFWLSILLAVINGTGGFTSHANILQNRIIEHSPPSPNSITSLNVSTKSTTAIERREILAGGLLFLSSVALSGSQVVSFASKSLNQDDNAVPLSPTTIQKISSIEEILNIIESSCDRRYLHAVVASDYKLMYRGIATNEKNFASVHINEASDLLLPSTYDSKEALEFFTLLEEKMNGRLIKPSNGHLATTSTDSAQIWGGYYASVWPLGEADGDEVHYSWLEDGGEFWPTKPKEVINDVNSYANSKNIIVDGIDCGRMSLDDALEKKGGKDYEIMFRAKKFLLVPSMYEQELLSGLKTAFII